MGTLELSLIDPTSGQKICRQQQSISPFAAGMTLHMVFLFLPACNLLASTSFVFLLTALGVFDWTEMRLRIYERCTRLNTVMVYAEYRRAR